MKINYSIRLPEVGVLLLQPFTRAKDTHSFKCTKCDHIWNTTPRAIIQSSDKHNTNSCPKCKVQRCYGEKRLAYLAKKPDYIEVLSPYDGRQGNGDGTKAMDHVHFRNTDCGHEFWCIPVDIFNRRVICPTCGEERRVMELIMRNRSKRQFDVEAWTRYKRDVALFTEKTYRAHYEIINPNNYFRGLNGVPDAYQLDHILPKAIGYALDIPPDLLSHVDNLQMLPWEENLRHSCSYKASPLIFKQYLVDYNDVDL